MLFSHQKSLSINCKLIHDLQVAITSPIITWIRTHLVSGFHPVQVHLTNRSDSSPVQDDVVDQHSNSLMVELSRPTPRDGAFTVHSPPDGQVTEDELSEFPEGMQREARPRFYLLILSLLIL